MTTSTVSLETKDRVATITMNCPERRNTLDDALIRDLTEAFLSVNRSHESRVVVLAGAGTAFCGGMNLDYLQKFSTLGHDENVEDAKHLMKLLQTIHTMKKPVIAMVQGAAMGGGCGIAAACDFVFAGNEKAKFGAPEVRLGFVPALILLYLIKRMGEGRAREFVLRGDPLDARTARAVGLATESVADGDLEDTVRHFALSLASSTSASSITLTKDLFARLSELSERESLEYAANLNALTRKTEDFKRGINAFVNKEKLQW